LLNEVRAAVFRVKCLASPKATQQDIVGWNSKELLDQPTAKASV